MAQVVVINGYNVPFPFEPYPAQVAYMQAVMEALDSGTNALLESPTGTGKTMCLLCATLTWCLAKRRTVRRNPRFDPSTGLVDLDSQSSHKIVYCSRTHAQLTQVIRELKRALRVKTKPASATGESDRAPSGAVPCDDQRSWSDVKTALLGSREHMCVNSEVSRLPSSHTQQSVCNSLRAEKGCRFFMGLQINKPENCLPVNENNDVVFDMEDLVTEGRKGGFCPYYLERELAKAADVVFMPYNYMLDPRLRKQLPFELNKNCIVIFDEAHNLPSVLSAAGCLTLQPLELANAIQDCTRAISMQQLNAETAVDDAHVAAARCEEFASLKLLLARLESCITSENLSGRGSAKAVSPAPVLSSDKGRGGNVTGTAQSLSASAGSSSSSSIPGELVLPGAYMEVFLGTALISRDVYEGTSTSAGMATTIDNAVSLLVGSEKPASGLAQIQHFLSAVFSLPNDESTRFIIRDHDAVGGGASAGARRLTDGAGGAARASRRSLGFWRLDNSQELLDLSNQLRCMLLTSGTLSPLDHFAAELGAPFPVRLCGAHVIEPSQVECSVLARGPTGERLNGSFASRDSVEYRSALGMTLVNVSRVTPGGTLVFFPSYAALNSTTDLWRGGTGHSGEGKTIWGLLSELKPVFVEPAGSGDLAPVVAEFQRSARESSGRGAILLAVCRGKISEGIDFADDDGRCVMVTGIPFANHTDLFIRLKREYLTAVAAQRPRVKGKPYTGELWYRHEAMRAVNQSIGRVIRHKDDFGAIVLADERFADQQSSLSEWVVPRTTVHRNFRDFYASFARFFTQRSEHHKHKRTAPATDATLQDAQHGNAYHSTAVEQEGRCGALVPSPSTANLAKAYALKHQLELAQGARERQRRRLEEVAETPVRSTAVNPDGAVALPQATAVTQHLPGARTCGVGGVLPAGCTNSIPRMQKQTLPQLPKNVTQTETVAGVKQQALVAAAGFSGLTSREFCGFLKERVSSASYGKFKDTLKSIAKMRGLIGGMTDEDAVSVRQRFRDVVGTLHAIFVEAAPAEVPNLLIEFGRHIPEEFRPLYAHVLKTLKHG